MAEEKREGDGLENPGDYSEDTVSMEQDTTEKDWAEFEALSNLIAQMKSEKSEASRSWLKSKEARRASDRAKAILKRNIGNLRFIDRLGKKQNEVQAQNQEREKAEQEEVARTAILKAEDKKEQEGEIADDGNAVQLRREQVEEYANNQDQDKTLQIPPKAKEKTVWQKLRFWGRGKI